MIPSPPPHFINMAETNKVNQNNLEEYLQKVAIKPIVSFLIRFFCQNVLQKNIQFSSPPILFSLLQQSADSQNACPQMPCIKLKALSP